MSDAGRDESKEERRQRQTKEQFEALGRYVQAFEAMVHELREGISWLTPTRDAGNYIVRAITNHRVMTAQPLLDIYRIVSVVVLQSEACTLNDAEKGTAALILDNIFKRAKTAIEGRNEIIHGTWHIGWQSSGHDADEDYIFTLKGAVTGKSLEYRSPIRSAVQLNEQTVKCEQLVDLLFRFTHGVTAPVDGFSEDFSKDTAGNWTARPIAR